MKKYMKIYLFLMGVSLQAYFLQMSIGHQIEIKKIRQTNDRLENQFKNIQPLFEKNFYEEEIIKTQYYIQGEQLRFFSLESKNDFYRKLTQLIELNDLITYELKPYETVPYEEQSNHFIEEQWTLNFCTSFSQAKQLIESFYESKKVIQMHSIKIEEMPLEDNEKEEVVKGSIMFSIFIWEEI